MNHSVRVQLLSTFDRDGMLEFVLIFPDHCEKHYSLDAHQIKAYRGAHERQIISDQAHQYFEQIGEPVDIVHLIFL